MLLIKKFQKICILRIYEYNVYAYLYITKIKMPEENKENLNQDVIQNGNPYDLVDNTNQSNQNGNSKNSNTKEPGNFLRKLIKTIAKMAWLPDPETWAPAKSATEDTKKPSNSDSVNPDTTLEQDVVAQEKQEEEKKKFSFENVMSWVSGVLDKIEKKVEEKTGLDLDAPLKKREERLQKEAEENKAEATKNEATPSATESETVGSESENEVEKNNEEYLSENH